MEEKKNNNILVALLIVIICWFLVRIAIIIEKRQRTAGLIEQVEQNNIEQKRQGSERTSEHEISRKRERILERSLEKSHLFNLYLKLIVISDKKYITPHGCEGFLYV